MNLYFAKFCGCKEHWENEKLQECHTSAKKFPNINQDTEPEMEILGKPLTRGDLYCLKILIKLYSPY
jgi:hypothetical protein